MKIDRLYTLSQFVDCLDTLNIKDFSELTMYPITMTDMEWTSACFHLTKKYNEFLKQPLKKEMFVNELPYVGKGKKFREWVEAAKKVIFEGFEKSKLLDVQVINSSDNKEIEIGFFRNGVKISIQENQDFISYHIENLIDLSEATNGELELKDLEI